MIILFCFDFFFRFCWNLAWLLISTCSNLEKTTSWIPKASNLFTKYKLKKFNESKFISFQWIASVQMEPNPYMPSNYIFHLFLEKR